MSLLSSNDKHDQYWKGRRNKAIRFYFYTQKGLSLLNEFRYLIMTILAVYALLKLDNPLYMVLMFFGSVPVLIALGWLAVHKIDKVIEYLNIQYATHWSRYQVDLQEQILAELKQLNQGDKC
ncbi:MAG: hypothetical protein HC880_00840 [Bacteroidia bacterium]|nr:hypothetical protein [Bacteroidia bacterium]